MKTRFYVSFSMMLNAWVIYDRHIKTTETSTGYKVLHGTDSVYRNKTYRQCEKFNNEYKRTGHVKELGI